MHNIHHKTVFTLTIFFARAGLFKLTKNKIDTCFSMVYESRVAKMHVSSECLWMRCLTSFCFPEPKLHRVVHNQIITT